MKKILNWFSIYRKLDKPTKLITVNEKCIPQFSIPYGKWKCETLLPKQMIGESLIGKNVEYMNINHENSMIGVIIGVKKVGRYISKIDQTQYSYTYDIQFENSWDTLHHIKFDKHLMRVFKRQNFFHLNITNEMIGLINSYDLPIKQMIDNGNKSFKVCNIIIDTLFFTFHNKHENRINTKKRHG